MSLPKALHRPVKSKRQNKMKNSIDVTKSRSCDACHQRKIHCDPGLSQCDWCKHHGLLCTFNRPFGRRKRNSTGPVTRARKEQKVAATYEVRDTEAARGVRSRPSPTDSLSSRNGLGPQPATPYAGLGGFYFNGFHLGGISSNQGIPFFSEEGENWILSHTGSAPISNKSHGATSIGQPSQLSAQVEGEWLLPDRAMVETYLSVFSTSMKRYVFPIIDEDTFRDLVEIAYDESRNQASHDVVCAQACILAFTCVMVHMEGKLDIQQTVSADQCAARVYRLMPSVLANPSSESLQVCAMCMYNMFSGNIATAAIYLSLAYRFASMLGAHLGPTGDVAISDANAVNSSSIFFRRVFWHCYMYDKDICLRAGYPPVIDDDHCNLTLPPGYKQIDEFDKWKDGSDLIPGDMRLTVIKSKVTRLLYCAKAFRKSEIELLKDIRELDDELETWRLSIPSPYRPNLASSYTIQLKPDWDKSKQVHIVVIHFEYYFLLALIHSASGRCRIRASEEMDHKSNVNSCQALALQASRSTLANLAVVSELFNSGDFWYFVLYPMSASLTIFCNILTSPLNLQAGSDLDLLQKVPGLIRDLSTAPLGPIDGIRIRHVEQFVEDLITLAQAAVTKASGN